MAGAGWHACFPQSPPARLLSKAANEAPPAGKETGEKVKMLGGAEEITPEIQELARGLQYDPLRIFDFVHNSIEYVPYAGALKGATRTLMDRSGNDCDQSSLLVALLRASGYTAQYVIGVMSFFTDMEMPLWLDLPEGTNLIEDVLSGGGIAHVVGATLTQTECIWVEVNVGGTNYPFVPAYKWNIHTDGVSLTGAVSYSREQVLAAAGGTSSPDYAQGLDETNLAACLRNITRGFSQTLQSNYPNASVAQIVSGRRISAEYLTKLPTSPGHLAQVGARWTNFPTNVYHRIRIQLGQIDQTLLIPEIAHKRVTVNYTEDHPPRAQLWVDDERVAQESEETFATQMVVTVDHPYGGTYADQTTTYNLRRDSTYVLISGFGETESDALIRQRQRKLESYLAQGSSSASREVTTESLNILGLAWMHETGLAWKLSDAVANVHRITHHRFGLAAQESGYYVDMKSQMAHFAAKTGSVQSVYGTFNACGLVMSVMEHGILEQYQDNAEGISTVKLLALANRNGLKTFRADAGNYPSIELQLQNYSAGDKAELQSAISRGMTLILPQDGRQTIGQWTGKGYVASKTGDSLEIGVIIGGGYHGGYASLQGLIDTHDIWLNSDYQSLQPLEEIHPTGQDPVDLVTGAYVSEHDDLVLGAAEPRGLRLTRLHNGGEAYGVAALGHGTTHSYDIRAREHTSFRPALGTRTPADAAPAIVALLITQDLMRNEDNAKGWLTAAMISQWAMDQLTRNAVSIRQGSKQLTYLRQPDGSYTPPPKTTTQLQKTNGVLQLNERFGSRIRFRGDGRVERWEDVDGNALQFAYNAQTNLETVTDCYGRTLTLTYSGGLLAQVADSAGRQVSYGYDGASNLVTCTDPEGYGWSYTFDQDHRITSAVDPLDQVTVSNVYDSLGRVKTQLNGAGSLWQFYYGENRTVEENPLGEQDIYYFDDKTRPTGVEREPGKRTTLSYDGQDHLIQLTDARGFSTQFKYDGRHNLTNVTEALSKKTTCDYDGRNRMVRTVDALGNETSFEYDERHHLTRILDALGHETTRTYYPDGLLHTETGPRGYVTTWTYDALGNPSSVSYPDGADVASVWTPAGDLSSMTDARGHTTTFTYDRRRLRTSETDANGCLTSNRYDAAGLPAASIDKNGRLTVCSNTATYKMSSIRYPDGAVVSNTYDSRDYLVAVTDPRGFTTQYSYDAAGRRCSATDPLGHTTTNRHDPNGNLVSFKDALGNMTSNKYDALNRLTWTRGPLSEVTSNRYDAMGRIVAVIDPLGRTNTFEHDALGRRTAHHHPDGVAEQFEYDAAGNLTAFVNGAGNRMAWGYDPMNRMIAETNALGQVRRCTFDGNGNRATRVDAQGRTTHCQYDKLNRLILKTYPDSSTAAYGYDPTGNLTGMVDQAGTTRQAFDPMNRLQSITDGHGHQVQYAYDPAGLRTNITYPDGRTLGYGFDAAARLTEVVDWEARSTLFTYDNANRLTAVRYPNGVNATSKWSASGFVTNFTFRNSTSNLISRRIVRNKLGLKTREDILAGLEPTPPPTDQFRTHNAADQLLHISRKDYPPIVWRDEHFAYDSDGNLNRRLRSESADVATNAYTWDFDDRLTLRQTTNASQAFTYDGQGDRVAAEKDGAVRHQVLDRQAGLRNVLVETDSSGAALRYFIWGPNGLLAQVEADGTVHYIHSDELGNVLALTDSAGNMTDQIAYTPQGLVCNRIGVTDTPYLFQGANGVYCEGDGLYHMKARYYDADAGRYISQDPAGLSGGHNFYVYAEANPLYFTDPFGFCADVPRNFWGRWQDTATSGPILPSIGGYTVGMVEAAVNFFPSTLATVAMLVEHPILTLKSIPAGIGQLIERTAVPDNYESARSIGNIVGTFEMGWALELASARAVVAPAQTSGGALQSYYPPNRGFLGTPEQIVLERGTIIDRYGGSAGSFASPQGTPSWARSLPPEAQSQPLRAYEVARPFSVDSGNATSWFSQPGGGVQYDLGFSVDDLIEGGYLKPVQ